MAAPELLCSMHYTSAQVTFDVAVALAILVHSDLYISSQRSHLAKTSVLDPRLTAVTEKIPFVCQSVSSRADSIHSVSSYLAAMFC